MNKPVTDKQKWEAIVDALTEDLERASPGEIDELLRAAGIDPVKLAEHYQAVAEAAIEAAKKEVPLCPSCRQRHSWKH